MSKPPPFLVSVRKLTPISESSLYDDNLPKHIITYSTISIDSGSYTGTSADWYIVVNTPSGWKSFDISQMDYSTSGLSVLLEDYGLIGFGPAEIFSTSSLSVGTYTYYFAVDLSGEFYYDSVVVYVE